MIEWHLRYDAQGHYVIVDCLAVASPIADPAFGLPPVYQCREPTAG